MQHNDYIKKFPFILFPEAWNNFNASYRNENNLYKFAAQLKEDLIIKYTKSKCSIIGCVDCLIHLN